MVNIIINIHTHVVCVSSFSCGGKIPQWLLIPDRKKNRKIILKEENKDYP